MDRSGCLSYFTYFCDKSPLRKGKERGVYFGTHSRGQYIMVVKSRWPEAKHHNHVYHKQKVVNVCIQLASSFFPLVLLHLLLFLLFPSPPPFPPPSSTSSFSECEENKRIAVVSADFCRVSLQDSGSRMWGHGPLPHSSL